ncbi:MAG TPA: dihydropteroate synthase [Pirellulales bacterium]
MTWQLRTRTLHFSSRPLLMGIVNVTPDSFSDGGRFLKSAAAIEYAQQLVAEGADLIDIGGESTRPRAQPVSEQEELDRVLPVIESVCKTANIPVSIDTSKASVASAAVAAGAEIINDITALRGDAEMLNVVCESGAAICVMHMQGTPQTMQIDPQYDDVVQEVFEFLRDVRDRLISAGMVPARICLDPGIGFGKTPQHNLAILANGWRLHELGCPVLVGHSRKSFLSYVVGDESADRTAAGIGVACALASQDVQILRVHDVAAVRQALTLFDAVSNCRD